MSRRITDDQARAMTTEELRRLQNSLLGQLQRYDDVAAGMSRTPRRLRLAGDLDRVQMELQTRYERNLL